MNIVCALDQHFDISICEYNILYEKVIADVKKTKVS